MASLRKDLLELKVRVADLEPIRAWARTEASPVREVRQTDTYYIVDRGRLKLREESGQDRSSLIYYRREDVRTAKGSHVWLASLEGGGPLRALLAEALGVRVVVRKRREIYRWDKVQIHLDDVDGLGAFVEFERVLDSPTERGTAQKEFAALEEALSLGSRDKVAGSYSDLLAASDAPREAPDGGNRP